MYILLFIIKPYKLMTKQIFTIVLILIAANGFTQISYEKGYFIDNQNIKTECLIKNLDWSNNPTSISYKVSEIDKSKEFTIEQVKEFGIYEYSKYKRYILPIDKSGTNINLLSYNRAPEWDIDTVFLKAEVEGVATLYSYKKSSLKRYFYSIADSLPQQLVYKKYITENGNAIENKAFQNQLFTEVKIEGITVIDISRIEYKLNDLKNYFIRFNEAKGLTYSKEKNKKTNINLFAKAGISLSSLSISNIHSEPDDPLNIDFGSEYGFRVGLNAEFFLPVNKGKWAVFIEPIFSSYKFEKEYKTYYDMGTVTAEINSVEIGFGVRYFVFLNDKSKFFLGVSVQYDMNFNSIVDYSDDRDYEILGKTFSFVGLGLGYNYNNWFSVEINRMPERGLIENVNWSADFTSYSINAGVNLLKIKDWF